MTDRIEFRNFLSLLGNAEKARHLHEVPYAALPAG